MQPKLRRKAVKSGEINVLDAYSTDSELQKYNLTEGDKHSFLPIKKHQC
ncbi:hypothetical protein ABEZ59_24435 [Peribacillus simplex]